MENAQFFVRIIFCMYLALKLFSEGIFLDITSHILQEADNANIVTNMIGRIFNFITKGIIGEFKF